MVHTALATGRLLSAHVLFILTKCKVLASVTHKIQRGRPQASRYRGGARPLQIQHWELGPRQGTEQSPLALASSHAWWPPGNKEQALGFEAPGLQQGAMKSQMSSQDFS